MSHEKIKLMMENHKNKIELFQWATISGVAAYTYSLYVSKMCQVLVPTNVIRVPALSEVRWLLDNNSELIQHLSLDLIDNITKSKIFSLFKDAPEFEIFNNDNINGLKTVFDLYIIPNMRRSIIETIIKKFQLDNPNNQQFREYPDITISNNIPMTEVVEWISEQTLLQLLMLIPSMKKSVTLIENNRNIEMADDHILTINNVSAITPIHFIVGDFIDMDSSKESVMSIMNFVTSTSVRNKTIYGGNAGKMFDGPIVKLLIDTDRTNQVSITKLEGIQI